jgi:hypothetical protein
MEYTGDFTLSDVAVVMVRIFGQGDGLERAIGYPSICGTSVKASLS